MSNPTKITVNDIANLKKAGETCLQLFDDLKKVGSSESALLNAIAEELKSSVGDLYKKISPIVAAVQDDLS